MTQSQLLTSHSPGEEGAYQMQHFVQNQGLNTFRLPVAWQYLVNAKLGEFDQTFSLHRG
jgi:endoglucanase